MPAARFFHHGIIEQASGRIGRLSLYNEYTAYAEWQQDDHFQAG
jgi:hypothetical protein